MPIILPPSDNVYEDIDYEIPVDEEKNERIREYLNVPSWKCSECGATMFGRCKECVYCKLRYNKHTPKPE